LQLPGSHVQLHTCPAAHTIPPGIAAGAAAYSPFGGGPFDAIVGCGDACATQAAM
jgi:hypothetical protein